MEAVGFVALLPAPAAMRRLSDNAKVRMVSGTLVSGGTVNEVVRRQGGKDMACNHAVTLQFPQGQAEHALTDAQMPLEVVKPHHPHPV